MLTLCVKKDLIVYEDTSKVQVCVNILRFILTIHVNFVCCFVIDSCVWHGILFVKTPTPHVGSRSSDLIALWPRGPRE